VDVEADAVECADAGVVDLDDIAEDDRRFAGV
jgi:hypothetical protein